MISRSSGEEMLSEQEVFEDRQLIPPVENQNEPSLAWVYLVCRGGRARRGSEPKSCCSVFVVGVASLVINSSNNTSTVWPLVRIYRGGFLLIEFLFLLGINTYGWRQAGVNHVLIFELNPRNNLSHQHLFEVNNELDILQHTGVTQDAEVLTYIRNIIYLFKNP